jgi:hypothetical protein
MARSAFGRHVVNSAALLACASLLIAACTPTSTEPTVPAAVVTPATYLLGGGPGSWQKYVLRSWQVDSMGIVSPTDSSFVTFTVIDTGVVSGTGLRGLRVTRRSSTGTKPDTVYLVASATDLQYTSSVSGVSYERMLAFPLTVGARFIHHGGDSLPVCRIAAVDVPYASAVGVIKAVEVVTETSTVQPTYDFRYDANTTRFIGRNRFILYERDSTVTTFISTGATIRTYMEAQVVSASW